MFIESRLKKKPMRIHFDPESILDKMYAKLLRQRLQKSSGCHKIGNCILAHTVQEIGSV